MSDLIFFEQKLDQQKVFQPNLSKKLLDVSQRQRRLQRLLKPLLLQQLRDEAGRCPEVDRLVIGDLHRCLGLGRIDSGLSIDSRPSL